MNTTKSEITLQLNLLKIQLKAHISKLETLSVEYFDKNYIKKLKENCINLQSQKQTEMLINQIQQQTSNLLNTQSSCNLNQIKNLYNEIEQQTNNLLHLIENSK